MRVAPARTVRIAVPAYADICEDTKQSIIDGCLALVNAGVEIEDVDVLAGTYIDRARSILVDRFLKGDADDLVFIDADVGFEPESLVRLVSSTWPIVGGVYPKKVEPPEWPVGLHPGEIWADRAGLVDVWMVPTGFMRINRAAFGQITVPTFADPSGQIGAYFKTEIRDGRYWGEDVEFCRLAREAGIPIRAIAEMDFRHVAQDGRVYRGNWGAWLKQQMKEAA